MIGELELARVLGKYQIALELLNKSAKNTAVKVGAHETRLTDLEGRLSVLAHTTEAFEILKRLTDQSYIIQYSIQDDETVMRFMSIVAEAQRLLHRVNLTKEGK